MKQIKIFTSNEIDALEEDVNYFMKTVEVLDVKLSEDEGFWTAMVIYIA